MIGPVPRLTIAAALALPLGGCVAAAIPIMAGGAIVQSQRGDERSAVAEAAPAASSRAVAPTPAQAAAGDYALTGMTELPAPSAADLSAAGAARFGRGPWEAFFARASANAGLDPVDDGRTSAFLTAPGSLAPETAKCGIQPPAVLLDLDPAGKTFDPAHLAAANPRLAQVLAALRAQAVEVLWISGNFADAAPAIRQALRDSGLDPQARDPLVLLRYPDERKQERRAAVAETHCVVAIAGDERADFDELFSYLRNPAAPTGLEPLIGQVWFLTPNPLS